MKLLILAFVYVVTVLGSTLYVNAGPLKGESYDDEHEPRIGESSDQFGGYGEKITTYKQTVGSVSKKEKSVAFEKQKSLPVEKESSVSWEGSSVQQSIVGKKSSSVGGESYKGGKHGKEYGHHGEYNHEDDLEDHYDGRGHHQHKGHDYSGGYGYNVGRAGKSERY